MAEKKAHRIVKAKIIFPLEKDEYGYPPFSEESMWGKQCENGYLIENIPFFIYNLSLHDVVSVKKKDNRLFYNKLIWKSTNSTIRIFCKDVELVSKVRKILIDMGCIWEFSNLKSLSAINVPFDISHEVITVLDNYESLSYEIASKRF